MNIMGTVACFCCRCCTSWVIWVCATVVFVTMVVLLYLYLKNKMIHIEKLRLQETHKENEFERKKNWEEFLRKLNETKDKSIAEKSDGDRISQAKDDYLTYVKSLLILEDIMKQSKPLNPQTIKEGRNNVEAFLENIKALSDSAVLEVLLKQNK